MAGPVPRGPITDAVLTAARKTNMPVGDAEAPRGGVAGWQGQPNADGSNFIPYIVITPLQAVKPTGPVADPDGDLIFPYMATSYGVSRQQCEWMADAVRQYLLDLAPLTVGDRSIVHSSIGQIGAVVRVPDTNPPYLGQSDTVQLYTYR